MKLLTNPFIVNEKGEILPISGNGKIDNRIFSMKKLSGYEYAQKGKAYKLYKWDKNKWQFEKNIIAKKDSFIEFSGLYSNTLYRFQDLARPFVISDSISIW
jgi:hypothetical protein